MSGRLAEHVVNALHEREVFGQTLHACIRHRRLISVQGFLHPAVSGETASYVMFDPVPSAVSYVRQYARAVFQLWHLSQDDIDSAQLLISELVTNSVKFAGPYSAHNDLSLNAEAKPVCLTLRRRPETVIVEVTDSDPTPPVLIESTPDTEGGRGLMLIQALSKEWNYYLPATGGKTVYCVISAERQHARD